MSRVCVFKCLWTVIFVRCCYCFDQSYGFFTRTQRERHTHYRIYKTHPKILITNTHFFYLYLHPASKKNILFCWSYIANIFAVHWLSRSIYAFFFFVCFLVRFFSSVFFGLTNQAYGLYTSCEMVGILSKTSFLWNYNLEWVRLFDNVNAELGTRYNIFI